jgi:hypothetical protein
MPKFLNIVTPVYAGDAIGTITPPTSAITSTAQVGPFISVGIRGIIVVGGLFAFVQFLLGGLGYITAGGDTKKTQDAMHRITYSIIGLVIIAASFIIIAILSVLLFGSWNFILYPALETLPATPPQG